MKYSARKKTFTICWNRTRVSESRLEGTLHKAIDASQSGTVLHTNTHMYIYKLYIYSCMCNVEALYVETYFFIRQ